MLFEIFRKYEIKINIEKCSFFQEEVEVLGHIVTNKGLKTMDSKVNAVKNWIRPCNINELRSFLGTVGYYRKFINNFAMLAAPLNKLLRKNVSFTWTEEQQSSFDKLKNSIIQAPILAFPDYNKQFIIRTDASKDGLGGVLLQINDEDGLEHPVHFVSRTLEKAERNYSITDLEGTAVYFCAKKFKSYISGNKFETLLFTDHKPLVGLFNNKEPNNMRHIRWCITISMLRIKIIYHQGKKNSLADALSRIKSNNQNINDDQRTIELSNKREVTSQEGKNMDLENKDTEKPENEDTKKSENFNKNENLKISNIKFSKINLDKKIKNFKIISNLKISREKARYIENPKIMEYSKNSINSGDTKDNKIYYNQNIYRNKLTNLNDNILEYINNMKNNINCNRHIQEINQNKLKKFINQLIQLKSNIIEYNNNILHNINTYILQYNERDAFMDEKHKIKDLCQLQNQLYQVFNNTILYMNKILENKIDTYINNSNYQVNVINHKDSSNNESANEIEQEQNEITTEKNKEIGEFMKEFLEDYIIKLNGEEYIKDGDNFRKIIKKNEDKFQLINKAHSIGHEGLNLFIVEKINNHSNYPHPYQPLMFKELKKKS